MVARRRSKWAPERGTAFSHAEWLSFTEPSGPFLSLPALKRAFPQGLPQHESEVAAELRVAQDEWRQSVETGSGGLKVHREWVRWVLERVLGWPRTTIRPASDWPNSLVVPVPGHHESLRPDLVLAAEDGGTPAPRILVSLEAPEATLDHPVPGAASKVAPLDRMIVLLRAHQTAGVRIGVITNGDQWMLVHCPTEGATSTASWWSWLWLEEPVTLRSFRALLEPRRTIGAAPDETLEALFEQSLLAQHEVTSELGLQVRRAVELLVQSIDRIDRDRGGRLLDGVEETELYHSAVAVMMRLVFLLYAEEQRLLPLGESFWDENYAATTLQASLRETADQWGEELLERRYEAWNRLIATFRAVWGGVGHGAFSLPAYGGDLFDPDRYPVLEGREPGSRWTQSPAETLPVDDRTVLEILESLQFLGVQGHGGRERRRLSFRALGVEEIGHVYESLLDHTALRAKGPVVSLRGAKDREPEVELSKLEELAARGRESIEAYLREQTGRSVASLRRALEEPESAEAPDWHRACAGDPELLRLVRPWTSLVRKDAGGIPVVIRSGSVYVTQGADRRSTGTHYTPTDFTGPIVKHALDPLVYEGPAEGWPESEWKLRSPAQILGLRVCDLAMGSGAFLVQTCRYLAERLVQSWELVETANPGRVVVTPEGDLSTGDPSEVPLPKDPDERLILGRRWVADRCLYGVDKDPMAVEMAKLSLWLISFQKGRPFTFVDHALGCGDSLLGVTRREDLEHFDLGRGAGRPVPLFASALREALSSAVAKREELERIPDRGIDELRAKARLLEGARQSIVELRVVADLLIGAALAGRGADARAALASEVSDALRETADAEREAKFAKLREQARDLLGQDEASRRARRRPLHWLLEFPEVFFHRESLRRTGFDAFIGNPPFQGGQKITGVLGTEYRDYLVNEIAGGTKGSADLCAYMFLRCASLVAPGGSMALIATNTIAQGDTRAVGLDQLLQRGLVIHRAVPSQKWPGEANLEIAVVWMTTGDWRASAVLSEAAVPRIDAALRCEARVKGKPTKLQANVGMSFQGSIILGAGFVLAVEGVQALLDKDPKYRDVLRPYINGDDLNSRWDLSPSRWVINFYDWPLEQAAAYSDAFAIVLSTVKPARDKSNRKVYRERWWQYAEKRPALQAALQGRGRVMVTAAVSKYRTFALLPANLVFSHQVYVFPVETHDWYACLSSALHVAWTETWQSSLETRGRYTPSDCFETFPFPEELPSLRQPGQRHEEHRRAVMSARREGLTATYNRLHDPRETAADIAQLRRLQAEMDQAVLESYGWKDVSLQHDFRDTNVGKRYTIDPGARQEILDRLLALNFARAEAEGRLAGGGGQGRAGARRKKGAENATSLTLFVESDARGETEAKMSLEEATEAILTQLTRASGPLSRAEILAAVELDGALWSDAIAALVGRGDVKRIGERRGARYAVADTRRSS